MNKTYLKLIIHNRSLCKSTYSYVNQPIKGAGKFNLGHGCICERGGGKVGLPSRSGRDLCGD